MLINIAIEIDTERDADELRALMELIQQIQDKKDVNWRNVENIIYKIRQWHHDRNLIEGATDKDQVCKLIQEVGELSDNVCKQKDVRDDIGDIIVVLINIAERNNITIAECLQQAYDDIKDRKGKMVDGIFIKEEWSSVSATMFVLATLINIIW